MSEAIVAGAVAGAIAGAFAAVAVAVVARRSDPRPRWRAITSARHATPDASIHTAHGSGYRMPFDRFNDRAKRVLALSQDEAIRLNHNYIGTEHLLAGLVREGEGVAAQVLTTLGVDLSKVRTALEFIIGRGDAATAPSALTLTPRTKKVFELAIDEARKLGHSHVGTEHLLLGLVREGEGIATGVIESLGVSLERVRHEVIAALGGVGRTSSGPDAQGTPQAPPRPASSGPFDRFDNDAKRALAFAQDEAIRFGHTSIGTEHLMLALLRGETASRTALTGLGAELGAARVAVEAVVPRGPATFAAEISLSPAMKSLIDRAIGLSRERAGTAITPVHLLEALVADPECTGATVLAGLGATPEKVREALDRLSPPPPAP